MQKKSQQLLVTKAEWPSCFVFLVVGLIGGASLAALFSRTPYASTAILCGGAWGLRVAGDGASTQLDAVLHYATTREVPQQTLPEITVTLDVLRSVGPCNFLVFGLGRDSLMWAALNPGGNTLFLEENPGWIELTLREAPGLQADAVTYRTKLSEADELLSHYRAEPSCHPSRSYLRGNKKCRLALDMLSEKVYDTEWDVIMVDAPRAYFEEAPGRMGAIYSAAVMARNRKKTGVTHVFVHDVNRRVESTYAEMFLCKKNMVKEVGKLWHFEIPPLANKNESFC